MDLRVFFAEKRPRRIESIEDAREFADEVRQELNDLYEKLNRTLNQAGSAGQGNAAQTASQLSGSGQTVGLPPTVPSGTPGGSEGTAGYRAGSQSLTGGTGNTIVFSTLLYNAYVVFVYCYRTTVDAVRETVGFDITAYDSSGFTVEPLDDCTIEYFAIPTSGISGGTVANYRAGKTTVSADVPKDVEFSAPLYSTYELFVYCYRTTVDAVRETVGYDITVTGSSGFTIVAIEDATVEYFAIPSS